MTEEPTLRDYMVGVLLTLKGFKITTSNMEEKAKKLAEKLSHFKDVNDVYASTLHTEVGGIASSLDLANLHNENAQKRIESILERIKK